MQGFGQEQQHNDGSKVIYWIWLKQLSGIGNHLMHNLIEKFRNPCNVYSASMEELLQVSGIGKEKALSIYQQKDLTHSEQMLRRCEQNQIKILTINDLEYPNKMKEIKELPIFLYYKGNLPTNSNGTAVVGARRCSPEGKYKAIEIAEQLAEKNIPVISGMAKGIDSYAHTACLKAGGYTIAVLGNGLDICYPSEHRILMERIEEKGLLLSEYEPGMKPREAYFPQRNRIIAGWSDRIIVVEAGKGSGALITADYGRKYRREVEII